MKKKVIKGICMLIVLTMCMSSMAACSIGETE